MWVLSLFAADAIAVECAAPVSAASVAADLADARASFLELDVDRFHLALDRATLALPCADAIVSPGLAAELHALEGVRWFVAGDERNAITAFAAAKRARPDVVLIADLFPVAHSARTLWASADSAAIVDGPVPVPVDGATWFDGVETGRRPEVPTVFQLVDGDGKVVTSAWLKPTDALPPYEGRRPVREGKDPAPIGWIAGAGASVVAASALYATASRREATLGEPHSELQDNDDLVRYARTTNAMSALSGVAAVAGLGLGVVAVVRF